MKALMTSIFLSLTFISFSQELNVGLGLGTGYKIDNLNALTISPSIEFRPVKSIVSLNSGIQFILVENKTILTFPLSINVIIGNKFRVCPSFGGFVRTNRNLGWSSGLSIEYRIKEIFIVLIKGDFNKDYWKDEAPTHFGGSYEYSNSGSSIWFSVGVKKNILKKSVPNDRAAPSPGI